MVSALRYNGQPEQTLSHAALSWHLDHQVQVRDEEEDDLATLAVTEAPSEYKRECKNTNGEVSEILPTILSLSGHRRGHITRDNSAHTTPPDSPPLSPDSRRSGNLEHKEEEDGNKSEQGEDMTLCKDRTTVDNEVRENEGHTKRCPENVACAEPPMCYMCYDTHDTVSDPLLAPCNCKGDTRYLHVKCFQKWYEETTVPRLPNGELALQREGGSDQGEDEMDEDTDNRYRLAAPQVIRTAANGSLACKICGSAYKTSFRRKSDGKKRNIFMSDEVAPYIVLTVVSNHEANATLFNTRFRINFTTGEASLRNNLMQVGGRGGNHREEWKQRHGARLSYSFHATRKNPLPSS